MRSHEVQSQALCLSVKSSRKPMETPLPADREPTHTPAAASEAGITSTGVAASL